MPNAFGDHQKCVFMHTFVSLTFTNAFPCIHRHAHTLTYQQCPELKLKCHFTVRACWPVPNLDQFGPASRALHFHWALHLQICQTQLFFSLSLSFLSSSSSSSFHQCKWLLTEWMKMISKASFLLAVLQNDCGRIFYFFLNPVSASWYCMLYDPSPSCVFCENITHTRGACTCPMYYDHVVCTHLQSHTHTHTHVHADTHTHTHMCMQAHTYTRACSHTHTHMLQHQHIFLSCPNMFLKVIQ